MPVGPDVMRMVPSLVIKLGGGLLADVSSFIDTLSCVGAVARRRPLAIVAGGGPFADAVRTVDRAIGLGDDEAHWMAVLAMDQFAHLVAARLPESRLVHTPDGVAASLSDGRIPVIAPYQWLRELDPLPHSWDVTSDSIAAWIAGQLGAGELLLVKPPEAQAPLVDPYFTRALPPGVRATPAQAGPRLRSVLEAC